MNDMYPASCTANGGIQTHNPSLHGTKKRALSEARFLWNESAEALLRQLSEQNSGFGDQRPCAFHISGVQSGFGFPQKFTYPTCCGLLLAAQATMNRIQLMIEVSDCIGRLLIALT